MNILGIVAHTLGYGDAASALLVGDRVVGIVEEERFSRIRYDWGFPFQSIDWLLRSAGLKPGNVDRIAHHMHPLRGAANRLGWMARYPIDTLVNCGDYARGLVKIGNLRDQISQALGGHRPPIGHHPHHLCHAAAAFYPSGRQSAACLILDGAGEGLTGIIASADRSAGIRVIRSFPYPHSLGLFYSAVCDHLGFPPPAGPGKVMGLAPYGDPGRFLPLMRKIARFSGDTLRLDLSYFLFQRNLVTPLRRKPWVSPRFCRTTGTRPRDRDEEIGQAHMDLAAALQARTNELGLELTRLAARLTGARTVCLGGGVALNSVMNGAIEASGVFDEVLLQPACGDAGNALGAAILTAVAYGTDLTHLEWSAYSGPEFKDEEIAAALSSRGLTFRRSAEVAAEAAEAIHQGKIVGWFQGRMEYGPRALGARSILADPQNPEMREIINRKVKHREWFRPFAPSVTEEAYSRYFTGSSNNPYMLTVCWVKDPWRSVFPAITHVDGSARAQSVTRETNPRYHALLEHLERIHGHPVVLNTSFNDNEPIVCTPDDAIDCFLRTKIDTLCIGNFITSEKLPSQR